MKKILYKIINFLRINNLIYYFGVVFLIKKENIEKTDVLHCSKNFVVFSSNKIEARYDLHIIVPCFNNEEYISKCLDSIFKQKTKFNFFVTVVNDGSTDKSFEIIDSYNHLQNIEIISKKNEGISSARNSALAKIRGKYIMFIDSDDYVAKDSIDNMLSIVFEEKLDVLFGSYKYVRNEETIIGEASSKSFPWGNLYKAELFKNLIFPKFFNFEDTIFNFLFNFDELKICQYNQVNYFYYQNEKGITHTFKNSDKIMDTFFVTEGCLSNMDRFNINAKDKVKNFLHQCEINHLRANGIEKLQLSFFKNECLLFDKYFTIYCKNLKSPYKYASYCFEKRKYRLYNLLNKIFRY